MRARIAGWLRAWAYSLDGRKVLLLDKAARYQVDIGNGWVKITGLHKGPINLSMSADKPVQVNTVGAGGAGGAASFGVGATTGRMHIHKPDLKQEPRPDGPFAPGGMFGPPVDCECDYWPGITGSNGRITQHAVNCPQRPDTKAPRPRNAHDFTDPHDMGEGR